MLRASVLGLISSLRLNGRKDMQSIRSAWSVLYAELKARILLPLSENNKERKMNIRTHTHHTHKVFPLFTMDNYIPAGNVKIT